MAGGYHTFTAGEVLTAANMNAYSRDQVVSQFASTSARDSAITVPVTGMTCYIASADSSEGLYTYNGTSWRKGPGWNAPWGIVAQASSTSGQTGISSSFADITFATATWTGISNRLYRITLSIASLQVTSNGVQQHQIGTGASGAPATILLKQQLNTTTTAAQYGPAHFVTFQTGSGSLSVHAQATTSAGTLTIDNANIKGWFVVDDVGPTGVPA